MPNKMSLKKKKETVDNNMLADNFIKFYWIFIENIFPDASHKTRQL